MSHTDMKVKIKSDEKSWTPEQRGNSIISAKLASDAVGVAVVRNEFFNTRWKGGM